MTKEYSADAGTALPDTPQAPDAPAPQPTGTTFALLPLNALVTSLTNPRKTFNAEKLAELAASIAASGVHQSILARPLPGHRVPDTPREVTHEIVSGERRYRASLQAKQASIPAMIRALTDTEVLEIQLIENLQRDDLTELEEADGYQQLIDATGISKQDLGDKIGKSRRYVYGRLQLLDCGPEAQQALRTGQIDASRALLIARIPDTPLQAKAVTEACKKTYTGEPMTLRQFEQWLRQNVMLKLADAPFNILDVRLVEPAGSCKQCPKRTGANPDIFADVLATDGGADICTDVTCFRAKESAHQANLLTKAEAKGLRVISGAEARDLHNYADRFDNYSHLNQLREDTTSGEPKRLHQLLDDSALKLLQPVLIEHPNTKQLHEMVPTTETEALLLARGLVKAETAPPGKAAAKAGKPQTPADKAKAAAKIEQDITVHQGNFERRAQRDTGIAIREAAIAALQALPDDACGIRLLGPTVLRAWLLSQTAEFYFGDVECLTGSRASGASTIEQDREAACQHIERSNSSALHRMAAISLLLIEKSAGTNATADEYAKLLQLDTKSIAKAATKDLKHTHDQRIKGLTAELASLTATPGPEPKTKPAPTPPGATAQPAKAKPTRKPKLTPQEATAAIAGALQAQAVVNDVLCIRELVRVTKEIDAVTLRNTKWAGKVGTLTHKEPNYGECTVSFKGRGGGVAVFARNQLTRVQDEVPA